jgi:hypothetical protein
MGRLREVTRTHCPTPRRTRPTACGSRTARAGPTPRPQRTSPRRTCRRALLCELQVVALPLVLVRGGRAVHPTAVAGVAGATARRQDNGHERAREYGFAGREDGFGSLDPRSRGRVCVTFDVSVSLDAFAAASDCRLVGAMLMDVHDGKAATRRSERTWFVCPSGCYRFDANDRPARLPAGGTRAELPGRRARRSAC